MKKILVVDDELGTVESLKAIFHERYEVLVASDVRQVFDVLASNRIELLVLDIILPKDDGIEILKQLRQRYPNTPVIMLSAISSTNTIAEAIRLGAVDFITKPFNVKDVRLIAERAMVVADQKRQVEATRRESIENGFLHEMPGESIVYRNFLHDVRQQSMNNGHVFITCERGAGADTVARLIHSIGLRSELPFIKAQCLPGREHSFDREFFGDETETVLDGGDLGKLGKLDLAGGGTIYIEDLHLVPASSQERILRLIEEGCFVREQGELDVKTNCRVVASLTMGNDKAMPGLAVPRLQALAEERALKIPSLRERPEDIPLLAYALINRLRSRMQVAVKDIDASAMEALRNYDWPGNVSELENTIEGILFVHPEIEVIKLVHIPQEIQWNRKVAAEESHNGFELGTLEERTDAFQRSLIIEALNEARGIKSRAADLLGTTPRILSYRMDQLEIDQREAKGHARAARGKSSKVSSAS